MLFGGDHTPGLTDTVEDGLRIEWFDGMDIDQITGYPFGSKQFYCLYSKPYEMTGSNDREI